MDPRLTGATMASGELWFAWGVDSGSSQLSNPFVQIARIDSQEMTLMEDINVFDEESATAYAALSTNAEDDVAISYMIGGGPRFPSHIVGMLTCRAKKFWSQPENAGRFPIQGPEQESGATT